MTPIKRIFIANRGEIAVRVIKTMPRLGHRKRAGRLRGRSRHAGRQIGHPRCPVSGLRGPRRAISLSATVVEAAKGTGCDAIHPGYGFLSENRALAEACAEEGIVFIGPDLPHLDAVGDKLTARSHAEAAQVPLVPGGSAETVEDARKIAEEIGFPLLIKAVSGGG